MGSMNLKSELVKNPKIASIKLHLMILLHFDKLSKVCMFTKNFRQFPRVCFRLQLIFPVRAFCYQVFTSENKQKSDGVDFLSH